MLHIVTNYHDPLIRLRVVALVCSFVAVGCLAVLEWKRPRRVLPIMALAAALFSCCLMIAYTVLKLRSV